MYQEKTFIDDLQYANFSISENITLIEVNTMLDSLNKQLSDALKKRATLNSTLYNYRTQSAQGTTNMTMQNMINNLQSQIKSNENIISDLQSSISAYNTKKTQLTRKGSLGEKLEELRTDKTSLVGIELLNVLPSPTPTPTTETKPLTPSTGVGVGSGAGGFMGGGAIGGGGGAVSEEGGVEATKGNKKTNYILLGLGGLALIYFLFLRKRN